MEGQYAWGRQEDGLRKGPWTTQEDKLLIEHVRQHGEGRWNSVSKLTGLKRSGKSCRLRWVNYLRPDLKRGKITPQEESIILELHGLWGNRWSTIARSLPGRTDNEIKNYWRTHFKKGKPSKNVERARARFLKQRREMQQQHLQGQQRDDGTDEMDMSQIEATLAHEEDLVQDMDHFTYPLSYLLHGDASGGASAAPSEGSSDDDGGATWGSLWNLGDFVDDVDGGACCDGYYPLRQDLGLAFY